MTSSDHVIEAILGEIAARLDDVAERELRAMLERENPLAAGNGIGKLTGEDGWRTTSSAR